MPQTRRPAQTNSLASLLPHPSPDDPATRALLIAARRMAVHGLHDASAALLMIETFGVHFRKPLVLLRAVMLDVSQIATGPIAIAPCCTRRMTAQEGYLLAAMACAAHDPARASDHLVRLTGAAHCESLLATMRVLAGAVAEAGHRLTPFNDVI